MKCQLVRSYVPVPGVEVRLPAPLTRHLAKCAPCREWQRRLRRVERHLVRIPVPPSTAREELVREVRERPA